MNVTMDKLSAWKKTKEQIRRRWSKLSDDDIEALHDNMDHVVDRLMHAYGYEKERAEQEYLSFKKRVNLMKLLFEKKKVNHIYENIITKCFVFLIPVFAIVLAISYKDAFAKDDNSAKMYGSEFKDYTYEQKDNFVVKMQEDLNKINADINDLNIKISKSKIKQKDKLDADQKIKELKDKATVLEKKIVGVKNTQKQTWSLVKRNISSSIKSIKESVNQTRSWLSQVIAP